MGKGRPDAPRLDGVHRSIERLAAGPATVQAFSDVRRKLEAGGSAAQILSSAQTAMRWIDEESDVVFEVARVRSALQAAIAVRLPEAVSAVSGVWRVATDSDGAASSNAHSNWALMTEVARLEAVKVSIEDLYRGAFLFDPALAERSGLGGKAAELGHAVDALIAETHSLNARGVPFGPSDSLQLSTLRGDVLQALDALWTASAFELDLMIKERMHQIRTDEGYRLAGLILVLLIAIGIGRLIARTITGPMKDLSEDLDGLKSGDRTTEPPPAALQREFGDTSRLTGRIGRESVQIETARAPVGERSVKPGTQGDDLQKMTAEFADVVAAARRGDLSHRFPTSSADPSVAGISRGVNELTEALSAQISNALEGLSGNREPLRAAGVSGAYFCAVERLQSGAGGTQDRLEAVTNKILTALQMLGEASESIDGDMSSLLERTKSEAQSLRETSASMERVAEAMRTSVTNASGLSGTAYDVGERATATCNTHAHEGADASDKMGYIVELIEEVALQTSILSLNASVEAVRAGEAGRRFAAVSTDVRALAERTTRSLDEMRRLVLISNNNVEKGAGLVRNVQAALTDVADELSDMTGDGSPFDDAKVARAQDVAHLVARVRCHGCGRGRRCRVCSS